MNNTKSDQAFRMALITLSISVIVIFLLVIHRSLKMEFIEMVAGTLVFAIPIVAIIGLVNSIQGIKDPNNFKKFFGGLVNLLILALLGAMIVVNIIDMQRALY
ncbi:MAG: hypothetical protein V4580_05030 [Bacteroidota bacterium]